MNKRLLIKLLSTEFGNETDEVKKIANEIIAHGNADYYDGMFDALELIAKYFPEVIKSEQSSVIFSFLLSSISNRLVHPNRFSESGESKQRIRFEMPEKMYFDYKMFLNRLSERFPIAFNENEFGVDYMGINQLKKYVNSKRHSDECVCFMFLETLFYQLGYRYTNNSLLSFFKNRKVLLLNTYNIFTTPEGNITHSYPQTILGLVEYWDENKLELLKDLSAWYVSYLCKKVKSDSNEDISEWLDINLKNESHNVFKKLDLKYALGMMVNEQELKACSYGLFEGLSHVKSSSRKAG